MDKAEKIKAARKKLKEFQSHKKDPTTNEVQNEPNSETKQDIPVEEPKIFENVTKTDEKQTEYIPQQISSYFATTQTSNTNSVMSAFHPAYQAQNNQESNFASNNNNYNNNNTQTTVSSDQNSSSNNTNDLQKIIDQQNHQISQFRSEVEFHRNLATNLQKNAEELSKLKQQESLHADTLKVLVTEKSNLMDSLQKSELQIQELKNENEELHNRLNVSRHRVKQLEMQQVPQHPAPNREDDNAKLEHLVDERMRELRESSKKIEAERNDLKLLVNQQKIEMENLQKNFDHLNTELHLATIKIAQLSDDTSDKKQPSQTDVLYQSQINGLTQEVAIKQQQITELNSIIDQLNNDRDVNETQYQNYVSAMSSELKDLKERSMELTAENESLVKREQELLKHVSDLERQMQHQIQKQKVFAEQNSVQVDTEKSTSQIASLMAENEALKTQLTQIESEKGSLAKALEEKVEEVQGLEFQVDKMRTMTPNMTQLMSDFEDKSTAASRALSQNQDLKAQLEELQRAFVNLSNDKMELTDKLQSEMHLCKEMKHKYDHMEEELTAMKEKWQFKENEMIRLSHENTELEKKILQQNIQIDRLRHYESKDYHGSEGIVENELEHCKHLIESLTNKINILESNKGHEEHSHDGHSHDHGHDDHSHSHDGHSHSHDGHSHSHEASPKKQPQHCDASKKELLEEIEMLKMEKNELLKAMNDFQMNKKSEKDAEATALENGIVNSDEPQEMTDEKMQKMSKMSVTPSIATEEALEKLQSRFRRTMLEVAELTEEKQRLEHVVTQLQFETETIGEYITLYQNQRRLLKQKEHERDIQLKNLAADREMMNEKLCQLNGLIEKFVLQHSDVEHTEIAKEATKLLDSSSSEPMIINPDNRNELDFEKLKKETAGKILEILSDIKTTNTRSYGVNVGVENCACCYGELKTV